MGMGFLPVFSHLSLKHLPPDCEIYFFSVESHLNDFRVDAEYKLSAKL